VIQVTSPSGPSRQRNSDCKAGAFVFASGLAIVPFLCGGGVTRYHWLTERQFVDAVAVAMITPGPIVIASGFGYLVAGVLGVIAGAFAVFAPPYFFVLIGAPYCRRFAEVPQVKAFVQGAAAAAVGAIAGAAYILERRSLVDLPTVPIAGVSFAVLTRTKRIPEPAVDCACWRHRHAAPRTNAMSLWICLKAVRLQTGLHCSGSGSQLSRPATWLDPSSAGYSLKLRGLACRNNPAQNRFLSL